MFYVFYHSDERARIFLYNGIFFVSKQSSGGGGGGVADQVVAVICLTECLSRRKSSFYLKEIIIQMDHSVRCFPFHSKQGVAIFFTAQKYK